MLKQAKYPVIAQPLTHVEVLIEVDGDEFSGEIELPIMEAGDFHIDLGSQQYIIRERN